MNKELKLPAPEVLKSEKEQERQKLLEMKICHPWPQ